MAFITNLATLFGGGSPPTLQDHGQRDARIPEGDTRQIYRDADSVGDIHRATPNDQRREKKNNRQLPKRTREEMCELKKDRDNLKDEKHQLQQAMKMMEEGRGKDKRDWELQNRMKDGEIHRLTKELKDTHIHQTRMEELLSSRTLELQGAQAFLTKADSLSGAEVISLMETLNSEILQITCVVEDSFEFDGKRGQAEGVNEILESLAQTIGTAMIQMLQSTHGDDLGLVVQIALQACIARYCADIVSPWHFENSEYGMFLSGIYHGIKQEEDQAVFGRWRALTKAQIFGAEPEESLMTIITAHMVDVLVIAGGGQRSQVEQQLVMKFKDRMATVGKLAFRLNKAVGQDVTSSDLVAFCIQPGAQFDPSVMEDNFAEGLQEKRDRVIGRVLCTCSLGLVRNVKVPGERETQTIILKPKIVLDSMLEEMAKA